MVTQTGRAGKSGAAGRKGVAADSSAGDPAVEAAAAPPEVGARQGSGPGEEGVRQQFGRRRAGTGGNVRTAVAAPPVVRLPGGAGERGGGVAAQQAGGDAVACAQGPGEGFEVTVRHQPGDRPGVSRQRSRPGRPEVVGGPGLGVPAQQRRGEIGDGAVEGGGTEGDGPQTGGEPLLGHRRGDPLLRGAQRVGDPADPGGREISVNIRAPGPGCPGERGQGTVGTSCRTQDEESTETVKGGERRVEVHEVR